MLHILISKGEIINSTSANDIIKTGNKIITQNNLKAIVLDISYSTVTNKKSIDLLEKILSDLQLPIIMIGS